MKSYIKPLTTVTPHVINWHWEGSILVEDKTIPVGNEGIELQTKGTNESWGDLW